MIELLDVAEPWLGLVVAATNQRFEEPANSLDLAGRGDTRTGRANAAGEILGDLKRRSTKR